jgi:hypothetical protein
MPAKVRGGRPSWRHFFLNNSFSWEAPAQCQRMCAEDGHRGFRLLKRFYGLQNREHERERPEAASVVSCAILLSASPLRRGSYSPQRLSDAFLRVLRLYVLKNL